MTHVSVYLVITREYEHDEVLGVFSSKEKADEFRRAVIRYQAAMPCYPLGPPGLDQAPDDDPRHKDYEKEVAFFNRRELQCPGGINACRSSQMRVEHHAVDEVQRTKSSKPKKGE
jgi:hypothetical protein